MTGRNFLGHQYSCCPILTACTDPADLHVRGCQRTSSLTQTQCAKERPPERLESCSQLSLYLYCTSILAPLQLLLPQTFAMSPYGLKRIPHHSRYLIPAGECSTFPKSRRVNQKRAPRRTAYAKDDWTRFEIHSYTPGRDTKTRHGCMMSYGQSLADTKHTFANGLPPW